MKSKIIKQIKILEAERGIKVLLACETGSRAWGFPSPDSDYDVRLIYAHTKDWYVSLHPKKDYINLMFDNNLIDLTGWDIRKSLNLLYRSNAAMLERIQSDQIYIGDENFKKEIVQFADDFYAPIAVMYHYLSLTKKMLYDIELESEFRLKKLFYALRSALVCKWVMEKPNRPPISIFKLMDGLVLSGSIKLKIQDLIRIKIEVDEFYKHKQEIEIINFIKEIVFHSEEKANQLNGAKNKHQNLNNFFLRCLNDYV